MLRSTPYGSRHFLHSWIGVLGRVMDRIEDRRVVNRRLAPWGGFVAVTLIAVVILLAGVHTANAYSSTQSTSADGGSGMWVSAQELAGLPMSGPAWVALKKEADSPAGTPDLSNQDQRNNVTVLAKALVFARTGLESYRSEVRQQLEMAIGTESGGRTLAFGRELMAYVIAADLINLRDYDPTFDNSQFRPWLRFGLSETLQGMTLVSTHKDRPNNWGTHAGASRIAVAIYLEDFAELERAAQVFKGWLGDRDSYAGFKYGDLSWQCDAARPVGINPLGCTKEGHSIDGVLPDDQRRGGGFTWPPPKENYVWEALQGALAQAVLLHRAGYDVWNWEDRALLRAVKWLHEQDNFPAGSDDTWLPHIVNFYYGTNFPAPIPSSPGKNAGWTDWTHATTTVGTVPTGLLGVVISSTQIDLSWDASTEGVGVSGYIIYRNGKEIGTTEDTSYQDTTLQAFTSYTYRVAAYDEAGNKSAKSAKMRKTTQPAPSTKFVIGDRVKTIKKANVRSEPTGSGTVSETEPKGAQGGIVGGPWYWNQQWWWEIAFDNGTDGWVAQGKLKRVVP